MYRKNIFIVFGSLFLVTSLSSQVPDRHRWSDRVILLFAPTAEHIDYQRQEQLLSDASAAVEERDLVVYHLFEYSGAGPGGQALPKDRLQQLRDHYEAASDGFTFVLIGKDGSIKLRDTSVVPMERLFGLIDSMPMRRAEMRSKKTDGGGK